jgi:hypothetical protein
VRERRDENIEKGKEKKNRVLGCRGVIRGEAKEQDSSNIRMYIKLLLKD